ncbi:MAG: methylase involved in ubiquinone/menaquinone biosynthesi, partial [Parcubacteria group bacterium Greene0714_36]
SESVDWSAHWSEGHQGGLFQKFFSFYRKHVFARTVRYFLKRYFPHQGIFLEAGSGTAETSVRVDKHSGGRVLVALDIVFPVLKMCDPVMDARVCGDGFHLPFRDGSLDGIWNLGVMEHFTHEQIDEMIREFRRVLKDGERLILFWPAKNSIPQKMLKLVEKIINLKKREHRFQFHPDEISQLASNRQAREILARNGFAPLSVDWGLRSLMAFKSVVGEKNTAAW